MPITRKKTTADSSGTALLRRPLSGAARVTMTYALFASLWIMATDRLVAWFVADATEGAFYGSIKGVLFVVATSLLLMLLLRRFASRLAAGEADFHAAMDQAADAIWIADAQGRLLFANIAAARLAGHDDVDSLPEQVTDFVADQVAHAPDPVASAFAMREWTVCRPDGACTTVDVTTQRLADGRYLAIGRDRTEARHAQLQLEAERSRLRALVRTIPDLVWLKDPAGIYLTCNPAFERFFGALEADIVGRTDHDFVDAELADGFRENDRLAIAAGDVRVNEEWVTLASDGRRILLETFKTPVFDASRELIGVLGIARDVTLARQAKEALSERVRLQEQLEDLSATVPGVIYSFLRRADGTMCMPYVSPRFEEICGLAPEAVRDDIAPVLPRIHPDDLAAFVASIEDSAATLSPWRHAFRMEHPVRGTIWIGGHAQPRREPDGSALWHGFLSDITVVHRVELAKADDAARRRILFEQAVDGIVVLDTDGRAVEANPSFARMLGRTIDEVLQLHVWDWDPTLDPEAVRRNLGAGTAPSARFQARMRRADGGEVDVDVSVNIVASGGQSLAFCVVRDITDQKRAEAALLESEERFRRVVESAPSGLLVANEAGMILMANAELERVFGYDTGELIGRSVDMLVPMGSKPAHGRLRTGYVAAPAVRTMGVGRELFGRRKDGGEVPIEVALSPLRTSSGTQILAFVIDITDRKRVALELVRYRDHLEELVVERTRQLEEANSAVVARAAEVADLYNNAPCGYHSVDVDGNILAMNDTELSWLGYRREEVVGCRRITDLFAPSSRTQFGERLEALEAFGEAHDIDYELLRRDGTTLPVSVSSTVQRDAAGRIVLIRTTVFDTSERRTRELQIAALNVELERRAGEAEAANRSKSAFLANMSHEIRTPMNAILGFTHMLVRDTREPEARDKLGKIGEAGRHLLAVINDILDLSKIEAGKLTLDHADFAVRQALQHVSDLVATRAQAADIELSLSVDPAVPPIVSGDITRVSQALLNFAGNAVKFTEHGRVAMRVSVDAETTEGFLLRFEVEDTGIGIAPEHLPRLFSAFEQADSSTTRRHGGTGLGLAISRRLAELMGGTVGVRSEPGAGSTFWFTVRVAPATAAPMSRTPGDSGAAGEGVPTVRQDEGGELRRVSGGARLLLVEDNEVNREVALDLLNEAGLRVDVAEDGAVAVAAARRGRYDLILMDMQMPVMDGLAATRAIRQLPEYAEVPILAMTANAFDEDRRQCLEAGMNDHVPKPVDPARLFATLMRWLPDKTVVRPLPVITGVVDEVAGTDAVARSPQDVQLARLAAVPGLDVTAGLRYSNGKAERYLRLLARYLAGDVGAVSGLAERFAAGDLPEVARRSHSLKGASGFIGATVLQALAAEVQASVDNALPEADIGALTGRLVATHTRLVKDISAALACD